MKTKLKIFIVFFYLCSVSFHPVHISLLSLNIDRINNKFDANLVTFSDDLENAVITAGYDYSIEGKLEYISSNLTFWVGDSLLNYSISLDSVGIESAYYKIFGTGKLSNTLTVENKIILNLYKDQKNILTVKDADLEKGYILNFKKPSVHIKLK